MAQEAPGKSGRNPFHTTEQGLVSFLACLAGTVRQTEFAPLHPEAFCRRLTELVKAAGHPMTGSPLSEADRKCLYRLHDLLVQVVASPNHPNVLPLNPSKH